MRALALVFLLTAPVVAHAADSKPIGVANATSAQRQTALWVKNTLLEGKRAHHATGLMAYTRGGIHRETSFGVTTSGGVKHDFPTAELAGRFAAQELHGGQDERVKFHLGLSGLLDEQKQVAHFVAATLTEGKRAQHASGLEAHRVDGMHGEPSYRVNLPNGTRRDFATPEAAATFVAIQR